MQEHTPVTFNVDSVRVSLDLRPLQQEDVRARFNRPNRLHCPDFRAPPQTFVHPYAANHLRLESVQD